MCKHCSKGSQVPAKGPRSQPVSKGHMSKSISVKHKNRKNNLLKVRLVVTFVGGWIVNGRGVPMGSIC